VGRRVLLAMGESILTLELTAKCVGKRWRNGAAEVIGRPPCATCRGSEGRMVWAWCRVCPVEYPNRRHGRTPKWKEPWRIRAL